MNCPETKPLIALYADGELNATQALEIERHLQDCPACAGELRGWQGLQKALRQETLYFAAPAALRRDLLAELRTKTDQPEPRALWSWKWLAAAMSGAATVCLLLFMVATLGQPSASDRLAQELVSSHVRSLMANHELDVVSTDQHTVKPWFAGKLDFAPPVKDLAGEEFPLMGGRLDYIGNRAVAALVYQRHKHVINLFVWPGRAADRSPGAAASRQGYHVVHWTQGGMSCWAVSDLNEAELLEFARDFSS